MTVTNAMVAFDVEPIGETMLLLRFGSALNAETSARVHTATSTIAAATLPGVVDIVPAYASLALVYDPEVWIDGDDAPPWRHLADALGAVFAAPPAEVPQAGAATVDVPVCYGGAHGADLAAVAAHCRLDETSVVTRHTGADYRVAMLGFMPGFAYLLGLDAALAMPRRAVPRTRVAPGSVAIGGLQTGIYPGESPGGWHVIGATPLRMFDVDRDPPSLLGAGDRVRFRAIDAATFAILARKNE